ncbi:hypothetical protein ACOME3_000656 [Neoechinorhynchus agilis]
MDTKSIYNKNWQLNCSSENFSRRAHAIFDGLNSEQLIKKSVQFNVGSDDEQEDCDANPLIPKRAIQFPQISFFHDPSKWIKYSLKDVDMDNMGTPFKESDFTTVCFVENKNEQKIDIIEPLQRAKDIEDIALEQKDVVSDEAKFSRKRKMNKLRDLDEDLYDH